MRMDDLITTRFGATGIRRGRDLWADWRANFAFPDEHVGSQHTASTLHTTPVKMKKIAVIIPNRRARHPHEPSSGRAGSGRPERDRDDKGGDYFGREERVLQLFKLLTFYIFLYNVELSYFTTSM